MPWVERCQQCRQEQPDLVALRWPLPKAGEPFQKIDIKMPGAYTPPGRPGPIEMIEPPTALGHQEGGDHYKAMKIQPIEFIHANGIPFAEGCVIKYVSRWRSKNGLADLKKARHFLDLLIELEEKARV
jgi:hypothetical protein